MSTTTATLQDVASVDEFLNVSAIETVPLFEHLSFDFLRELVCSPPPNVPEAGSCMDRSVCCPLSRLVVAITNYKRGNDPGCEKV